MSLVEKNDIKQIFADQAPSIDKPASFANYPRGWDAARPNNGKPTIKQFNYLQQRTDQNFLWMHQNGAALPYDATMEYAEGAVVVKDGKLQKKQGDSWVNVGVSTAAELMDESGKNQQEVNNEIPMPWLSKTNGYSIGSPVLLANGTVVRSTVNNNTTNPSSDLTGWVVERDYVDLIDFIPKSEHANIINRVSAYDCTPALTKAHATGKRIEISVSGTYVFKTAFTTNKAFNLVSKVDGVVFDYSDLTAVSAIEVLGTATQIANLSADVVSGSRQITLASTDGISSGDWICLSNPTASSYSGFRTYYKAGEWIQVLSVSGNTITTMTNIYADYTVSSINVYRMNSVNVNIGGNKIKFQDKTGNVQYLVTVIYCANPQVSIDFEMSHHAAIRFDRCVEPKALSCVGKNFGKSGEETNYAIALSNCQHARIIGGDMYAARHAITMGGNEKLCCVPNRDNRVFDATLTTSPTFSFGAADMHGNVEDCSYERCVIYGGTRLGGGGKNFYKDCVIHGDTSQGKVGHLAEIVGGHFQWINCEMYAYGNPAAASRGVFDVGGNSEVLTANTLSDVTVSVIGGSLSSKEFASNTALLLTRNAGASVNINPVFKGVALDVNDIGSFIRINFASGTALSQFIICDDIITNKYPLLGFVSHGTGGQPYLNFPHRIQRQNGVISMTTIAASVLSASTQTYKFNYPRKPVSNLSVRGASGATDFGGQVITPSTLSIGTNSIRPQVRSQSNMTAGVDFELCWEVGLSEC